MNSTLLKKRAMIAEEKKRNDTLAEQGVEVKNAFTISAGTDTLVGAEANLNLDSLTPGLLSSVADAHSIPTPLEKILKKLKIDKTQFYILCAVLISILTYSVYAMQSENPAPPRKANTLDTVIPAGYTLYPIEILNFQAINAILGRVGIVDLYVPSGPDEKNGRKVGNKLRIVRAPGNPSRFAVVVPDDEVPRLMSQSGPFNVVIRSAKEAAGGIIEKKQNRQIRIH